MDNKVQINTLSEYVKCVSEIKKNTVNNALLNETLLFRGHEDSTYTLQPVISRDKESPSRISILDEEREIIDLAKMRLPDIFREDMQPLELLAIAQHYGLPTRLLDVTENALVALFFACEKGHDKDGEVFVFKIKDEISNMPIIQAIADSYRLIRGSDCPLEFFFKSAAKQTYFLEHKNLVDSCYLSNNDYAEIQCDEYSWVYNWDEMISKVCSTPLFVYAPTRTLRQQNQKGRYILFPNRITKSIFESEQKQFSNIIDPIERDNPCIAKIITIPASGKENILHELKMCGISRDFLFADSIEEVCNNIKEVCFARVK